MIKAYSILILAGLMFSISGGFYVKGFDAGHQDYDQQAFDAQFRFPVQHSKHKHHHHSAFDVLEAGQ